MNSLPMTTTRKQLRGYGATHYLARKLTESLTPVDKHETAYVYDLAQTITSIREYGVRPHIRPQTKETLSQILADLLSRIDNVISLPVGESPAAVGLLAQQAIRAMHKTDKALAELKATAASLGEPSR